MSFVCPDSDELLEALEDHLPTDLAELAIAFAEPRTFLLHLEGWVAPCSSCLVAHTHRGDVCFDNVFEHGDGSVVSVGTVQVGRDHVAFDQTEDFWDETRAIVRAAQREGREIPFWF